MKIYRLQDQDEIGAMAAEHAATHLRTVLQTQEEARIVAATGASQFSFLQHLVAMPDIAWSRVTLFHLDEYVGLPADHPASFRRYLKERLIDVVHPGRAILIDGESDPWDECHRVSGLIKESPIDIAFVGIGENGHLAFNDPPADFETTEPYVVVTLDQACRAQQVAEGWFPSVSDVPEQAISMSIAQIMAAHKIICVVPGARKAEAVRACLEEDISPLRPASILRRHAHVEMFIDAESGSLLRGEISSTRSA